VGIGNGGELGGVDRQISYEYYFPEYMFAVQDAIVDVMVQGRNEGAEFLAGDCGTDYVAAGVAYSYSCPPEIAVGEGPILRVRLQVLPDAPPGPTILNLEDNPPSLNRQTRCDGGTEVPVLSDGLVTILTPDAVPIEEQVGCELRILGVWPNPAIDGATTITYRLPHAGRVVVDVFDVSGRVVRSLVNGDMTPGIHRLEWDGRTAQGRTVDSGAYFVRVRATSGVAQHRILLIR
jgi:hypothetical protein